MRKINQQEKILSISVGLLMMLFVLKNFVLGPLYEKAGIYANEIEQSKMAIRKYMALEHHRPEILKVQKQIEGYSSLKGSDEYKSAMIMNNVEAEARKSKLQILNMNSAGSSKMKNGVTLHRINLLSEGQLKNVLDFIAGIEGANVLLQVEKINLSAKDETGSMLKMEVTVLGVSFS